VTNRFLLFMALPIAALCGGASAEKPEVTGRCTLTYEPSVNAEGPCTVTREGAIVTIRGTVAENSQEFVAVIDNSKDEGLLIGAGTFTLADGALDRNEEFEASWPNGYILTIKLE
jgi:hypothetical protein